MTNILDFLLKESITTRKPNSTDKSYLENNKNKSKGDNVVGTNGETMKNIFIIDKNGSDYLVMAGVIKGNLVINAIDGFSNETSTITVDKSSLSVLKKL